jgi:hemerythrin-like domain-containing protein
MPNAAELLMEEHRAIRRLLVGLVEEGYDRDAVTQLVHDVRVHTDAEERFLYPVVADSIPDCRELVDRAPAEHQQLRDAVAALERTQDPDEFGQIAAAVRAVFEPHVRVEEAELLPRCQDEFGEARMVELGRELDAFRDAH